MPAPVFDPNYTMAELPHPDVIRTQLQQTLADPNSSPEEQEAAKSFLSEFWGKASALNGPLPEPCEFDGEPQIPEPTPPVHQSQPSGQWEPSDGTLGKAATPQPFDKFKPVEIIFDAEEKHPRLIFKNPGSKA